MNSPNLLQICSQKIGCTNAENRKNKGIKIEKIPGDEIGLSVGLDVKTDFFGNTINGLPDLGAVELKD